MAVHPDYGNRVQTLLDKYNAEGKKVENIRSVSHTFIYTEKNWCRKSFHSEVTSIFYN